MNQHIHLVRCLFRCRIANQNILRNTTGILCILHANDLQGAVYQEIVRQNTGLKLPFFIAAATKEKEPDIDIIEIPQPYLDVSLEHFKENVIRYDGIKKYGFDPDRCGVCDWCKMTKVLSAPRSLEVLNYE